MKKLASSSCILLHGAWHGGWVWTPILQNIQQIGYFNKIIAPTLPGHFGNIQGYYIK